MPVAVITGASKGLGRALAERLAGQGWSLVLDARHPGALREAAGRLPHGPHRALPGDVADPAHRRALADAALALGGADLLVNNASTLGASPMPSYADLDPATYLEVLTVNLVAPMDLTRSLLTQLRDHHGTVVNVSSDAAVEPYPGWGGYGSSKAALDHASRILAEEETALRVLAVDPGDMRTDLHQAAFPEEDISDRPGPERAADRIARLILDTDLSGRVAAADVEVAA